MNYIKLVISIHTNYQEALIAELEEMGFDGYQQFDSKIEAHIRQSKLGIGDREYIGQLLSVYPGNNYIQTENIIEDKNWNRAWEKTIQPQEIGCFLVRSTWSTKEPKEDQFLLEIDPKRSFGTGYHATTQLMLTLLPKLVKPKTKVLDAGTGTGILAIAAAKLGVQQIIAFDTDKWSVQNAKENICLNEATGRIDVRKGSLDVVKSDESFDVISANINKNTILELLPGFSERLREGGTLLLSGILREDIKDIKHGLTENQLTFTDAQKENEWTAVCAKKACK